MSSNQADYILDWSHVYFDPARSGAPYVMTQSGKRSYLPPIVAGQLHDNPQAQAWARTQGVSADNPSGNVPHNTFVHQNNGWNADTGQYDQSLNQGGLMGLIEGGTAVAAPFALGALMPAAPVSSALGGTGLAADGTLASTLPAAAQSAAMGGQVIPAAGIGAGASAADIAAGASSGSIGAGGAAGLANTLAHGGGAANGLTDALTGNTGTLAALLTSLLHPGGGSTGQDDAQLKRIQAITEARMRRADPLHQMVVQLAASRMPTNVQRPVPDVPLPQ